VTRETNEEQRAATPTGISELDRITAITSLQKIIEDMLLDDDNEFVISVDNGWDTHAGRDGLTTEIRANKTMTITILINGGAQGTVYPEEGSRIYRGTD
tara:strand:- start:122 stop:418 length:297 start_codon:yes stop_codon:yes gene_type:complete